MDNFYEQLMTTYKTVPYKMASFFMYVGAILGVAMIYLNFVTALLLLAISGGLFFLSRSLYIEYEYDFTNGDIDIDKIIHMSKRKRTVSFNVKDIEVLAPINSDSIKDFSGKPDKLISCYPATYEGNIYIAMVTGGADRFQLKFAPDEEFLNLCYKYNPRAIKKY